MNRINTMKKLLVIVVGILIAMLAVYMVVAGSQEKIVTIQNTILI